MTSTAWRPFLERYSRELLADRDIRADVAAEVAASGWMGFEPASATEIAALEERIGLPLPPSYRDFLATTDGWRQSGAFIDSLFPTTKVDWLRHTHRDLIDAFVEPYQESGDPPLPLDEHCVYGELQDSCNFRVEFLQSTLQISDYGDSAFYLLNPEVRTADGEWEAWFFASWSPGATRYRTFRELMEAELDSFVALREHSESRYFPEDGLATLRPKLPSLSRELTAKADRYREHLSPDDQDTAGTIAALDDAATQVRRIETVEHAPEAALRRLVELAAELTDKWQANFKATGEAERGRAEGNRQAAGCIKWFVNQD